MSTRQQATLPRAMSTARRQFNQWRSRHRKHVRLPEELWRQAAALARNMPEELKTIVANCLAHRRRRFVEVAMNFPQECLHVLEVLKDVYKNDAEANHQGMSPEQRLRWHQTESGPKMADLET